MTLPDGEYSVTTERLTQETRTVVAGNHKYTITTNNSPSYVNVFRLQTPDSNIPEKTRGAINNDMYLFHADQKKGATRSYNSGISPSSAGCPIVSGQIGQDLFVSYLEGVDTSKISITIKSGHMLPSVFVGLPTNLSKNTLQKIKNK